MKHLRALTSLTAIAFCFLAAPALDVAAAGKFAYKPPLRGTPAAANRVGGGTRGPNTTPLAVTALAPSHIGNTVNAQPTLYWFTATEITSPVELVVLDGNDEALVETTLTPPLSAGFHAISLKTLGVSLQPGTDYQWYVAVVVDAQHRSKDVIAGSDIRRVSAPGDLAAKLNSPENRAAAFAEAGMWYDAIETLGDQIAAAPNDASLKEQRAALLEQVGLDAPAQHARAN